MFATNKTWDTVMRQLRREGEFHLQDLDFNAKERHEVRLTLRYMRNKGWLCSPTVGYGVWYPGPMYNDLFGSDSTANP